MAAVRIGDEELVVHTFVPLGGPEADDAYRHVQALWDGCQRWLGMGNPVPGSRLPVGLPADREALPPESDDDLVIAAQESRTADCQAVVRRMHDALTLSAALAPRTESETAHQAGGARVGWADLDQQWSDIGGDTQGPLLGEVRLYLGKVYGSDASGLDATAGLARAARQLLPAGDEGSQWWERGINTQTGFAVWEVSPLVDTRQQRRIVVLAAGDQEPRLSAWTWSDGRPLTPPLARYLLHAGKLRHQLRVWNQGRDIEQIRGRIAEGVAGLQASLDVGSAGGLSQRAVRDGLVALHATELSAARALAALRAMRMTVEMATDNMAAALAPEFPEASGDSLFGDDQALSRWFSRQLGDEIAYLQTDQDLARQVTGIVRGSPRIDPSPVSPPSPGPAPNRRTPKATPTIGIVTVLPEEFHAVRALLDSPIEDRIAQDPADYIVGSVPSRSEVFPHQVVLTQAGSTGTNAAADATTNICRSFPAVSCVIMTGVAAGVPNPRKPERHVRLGDIVVATWGIVDYDHVVMRNGTVELRSPFPRPSPFLCRLANRLQADELKGERPWENWMDLAGHDDLAGYERPPDNTDLLATDAVGRRPRHPARGVSGHRKARPKVHYGLIGSADRSLRDAHVRDELTARYNVRAFEMEGEGIGNSAFLNGRQWFMVRGISDYADKGFNDRWRRYASLAAASYVRALLAAHMPSNSSSGDPSMT